MERKMYVYGDSLLKATVPDKEFRYHFHTDALCHALSGVEVVNRSKMGATIRKGLSLVRQDLQRGMDGCCALVAYGGNDSDFDWQAISDDPTGEHKPKTELPEFRRILAEDQSRQQPELRAL